MSSSPNTYLVIINDKFVALAAIVCERSEAHAAVRAIADMMELQALYGHGHDMSLERVYGPFDGQADARDVYDKLPEYTTDHAGDLVARPELFDVNNPTRWM